MNKINKNQLSQVVGGDPRTDRLCPKQYLPTGEQVYNCPSS